MSEIVWAHECNASSELQIPAIILRERVCNGIEMVACKLEINSYQNSEWVGQGGVFTHTLSFSCQLFIISNFQHWIPIKPGQSVQMTYNSQ